MARHSAADFRSNLAVFLAGLVLALLFVEGGLRVADVSGLTGLWQERRTALHDSIWMKSDNPELMYVHRPNYYSEGVRFTENSGILRPDDVAVEADGIIRIAVIGDSVAAATRLPYPQRFVTRLEDGLAGIYTPAVVEVLNFGVNGYSTLQEAALLESVVDRFSPHILVLQYCMNDFYPSERPSGWFAAHSPLYTIDFITTLIERRNALGYPPAEYWESSYRQDAAGWRNVERGFARISGYAASRDIPVLLVVFPLISREGWYAGSARERHARIAAAGEDAGLDVLDLLPVFAEHNIETIRDKPWDTFHPNELGHRIAATAITGEFRNRGYLHGGQP